MSGGVSTGLQGRAASAQATHDFAFEAVVTNVSDETSFADPDELTQLISTRIAALVDSHST